MPTIKILNLDTEKNVLLANQSFLNEAGYYVDIATNEQEALDKLSRNDFAILITEFYLRGKDTIDLIKKVKQDYQNIYIIMISAATLSPDHYEAIINVGVDDYFTKPFPPESLLVNIRKGLKRRSLIENSLYLQKKLKTLENSFAADQRLNDGNKILYNLMHFNMLLAKEIVRAKRYDHPFCLLTLHITNKTSINNQFNVTTKHESLNQLSQFFIEHTRKSDIISRYNGDFVLILLETSREGTEIFADRLVKEASKLFSAKSDTAQLPDKQLSIDYLVYPEQSEHINHWITAARKEQTKDNTYSLQNTQ